MARYKFASVANYYKTFFLLNLHTSKSFERYDLMKFI